MTIGHEAELAILRAERDDARRAAASATADMVMALDRERGRGDALDLELIQTRAALERAEADRDGHARRASIAESAKAGAERREHEARAQTEALWERALRAEGEVVGWMGAFGRLVDALARECAR